MGSTSLRSCGVALRAVFGGDRSGRFGGRWWGIERQIQLRLAGGARGRTTHGGQLRGSRRRLAGARRQQCPSRHRWLAAPLTPVRPLWSLAPAARREKRSSRGGAHAGRSGSAASLRTPSPPPTAAGERSADRFGGDVRNGVGVGGRSRTPWTRRASASRTCRTYGLAWPGIERACNRWRSPDDVPSPQPP